CAGVYVFFFSSRRRHTMSKRDWSSDVCSSDLTVYLFFEMRLKKSDYLFYNVWFHVIIHLFYFVHWLDLKCSLLLLISFYLMSLVFFLLDILHAMYLFLYQTPS